MPAFNKFRRVAYGLSDALLDVPSQPVISDRAPTVRDQAPLGTIWIDKPNNDGYILTSVVANSATWIGIGGGPGEFTNVDASGYVHAGADIVAETDITATTGDITATAGDIIATAGDIIASAGDITASLGAISALGAITSSSGNIAATLGSVTAGTTVTAGTNITALTGNITSTLGSVKGVTLISSGDLGGTASTTSISNATNTTQGAGTLSIKATNGNNGDNTGFLKFYVGTTAVFVPYFVTITPP